MGCCKASSPIKVDKKRYNINHLNEHCYRKYQLVYFKQQQKEIQQKILQKQKQIQAAKIRQIEEKEKVVQLKFQKLLSNARADSEKARQIEIRRNMTMEQIIGLESSRRRFIEIKNIVRKNITIVYAQIQQDMKLRFDLIESQLKQGLLKIQQSNQQINEIKAFYSNFVENRTQQIERGRKQVDQKIYKAFNFQKYTAKYQFVIPHQELMTITLNEDKSSIKFDQFQQTQQTEGVSTPSCCCFPEE